jgi:hypothetical protein
MSAIVFSPAQISKLKKMAVYESIVKSSSKSPAEREDHELAAILPWLKKKSPLFQSTKQGLVISKYTLWQQPKGFISFQKLCWTS